jgi:hypothetical protein
MCRRRLAREAIVLLLAIIACRGWAQSTPNSDPATSLSIPPSTPLRVEVTQTIPLKVGKPWSGRLIEPVYGPNRLLLPAGTTAEGVLAATPPADRSTRVNAKLDGDFTPLRLPVIRVTQLVLPSGTALSVEAVGGMRNAETISLAAHPRPASLGGRLKAMLHAQVQQAHDTVHSQHRGDLLKQLLYRQLPYHPQRVWAGSQFDAVLREPLQLPAAGTSPPIPAAGDVDLTSGHIQARLTAGISSASARHGDSINAVLTKPFCNPQGHMMLPSGTALHGIVLQARPARWFGRSGRLRFDFRSVEMPATRNASRQIESSLSSIQGQQGQNVALDSEGGARAQPDRGRYLAPLVLGGLAAIAAGGDNDDIINHGVTSNGFGIPARIVTMAAASRDASLGFAIFATAKSVYRRFIARGHEISFPENTELAIDLSKR